MNKKRHRKKAQEGPRQPAQVTRAHSQPTFGLLGCVREGSGVRRARQGGLHRSFQLGFRRGSLLLRRQLLGLDFLYGIRGIERKRSAPVASALPPDRCPGSRPRCIVHVDRGGRYGCWVMMPATVCPLRCSQREGESNDRPGFVFGDRAANSIFSFCGQLRIEYVGFSRQ